ncbi:MAG: TIGR02147 family protein [Bdellovibrionaceae bacterium]|nr:TIGR02147 family protein [Pseudobdellovibrionaceae bacterium]
MSFQYVEEHREYLKTEYLVRARTRPSYSQRAFARDIGLSPSALTDYFKGRIRLTSGRIAQVSKSIGLTTEQRQHWVDLVEMKYAKTPDVKKISELRVNARIQSQNHSITVDQFKLISEWFHTAYLELIKMDAVKYSDVKLASGALNIPVQTLRVAVKRLEKAGLLKENVEGLFQVLSFPKSGDGAPSIAVRQFQTQMIKKALAAVDEQSLGRSFTETIMVALPEVEAKKIFADLQTLALRYLEPHRMSKTSEKDSLYCLSLQFFDVLSKKENSK